MPRRSMLIADVSARCLLKKASTTILLIALGSAVAYSKDVPLNAIELYDGPNGAAFVQLTGLLINGKAELRACGGATQIGKANYGKLAKVALNGSVTSLQRDAKGTMTVTHGTESECVVPSNLRFDKDEALSPAQLADKAVLQGQVVSSSIEGTTAVPAFKPGVKIVFVAAPDTELAEYLRADRANSTTQWQDYLARYSKAAHTDAAKQALATLLLQEGQGGLIAYRKSAASATLDFAQLRTAYLRAGQVGDLIPGNDGASKLRDAVHAELSSVADKSRAELQSYKQAFSGRTAGYSHLANSRLLDEQALGVDPHFEPCLTLQTAIGEETKRVETAMKSAESLMAAQRFDDAAAALTDFRAFAGEDPRIAGVIDAAYKYHFDRGSANAGSQKWREAVQEYQRAADLKSTTEATNALKQAQASFQTSSNQAAANAALQQSEGYQQEKNFIEAYEVLANLPDGPRALVKDQMQALEADYIKSASEEAKKLLDAHSPIQGRVDEIGVQKAHDDLQRASALDSENANLKMRLDLVSQTLSDYYVTRAKVYLDKPLGSGVGIAWLYLHEAQQYMPTRDDIRDERTKYSAIHNIRSTLSIKVVFRDQTSRRDSAGFAEMLQDAIATGIETTALPVRIIRASDSTPLDANFQLIGDVIEHRPISKPTIESLDSEYRAAEREVPNEDWTKANREYDSANLDLQKAQTVLQGAQSHGKKKEIATASQAVDDAQKKVEQLRNKLDSIPRTILTDVVKPYSYTKKTIDLSAVVELGFRIVDANGSVIESSPSIKKEDEKRFIVLENVKPEDVKNIKQIGAPPDESQFLGDVEIGARGDLIKDVKTKIELLPDKILAQARKKWSDGDTDGTAESYILYLNSTPDAQTPERDEAKKFLREQFNISWPGSTA